MTRRPPERDRPGGGQAIRAMAGAEGAQRPAESGGRNEGSSPTVGDRVRRLLSLAVALAAMALTWRAAAWWLIFGAIAGGFHDVSVTPLLHACIRSWRSAYRSVRTSRTGFADASWSSTLRRSRKSTCARSLSPKQVQRVLCLPSPKPGTRRTALTWLRRYQPCGTPTPSSCRSNTYVAAIYHHTSTPSHAFTRRPCHRASTIHPYNITTTPHYHHVVTHLTTSPFRRSHRH